MKKLLLVLVLFMGACSTTPEEVKPTEDGPIVGPQLNLTVQNPTEQWLKGTWTTDYNVSVLDEYKHGSTSGKRLSKHRFSEDGQKTLLSDISYEIREDFFGQDKHLLIPYISDQIGQADWDKGLLYYEIVKNPDDSYTRYARTYDNLEDFGKGPLLTTRRSEEGTWVKK